MARYVVTGAGGRAPVAELVAEVEGVRVLGALDPDQRRTLAALLQQAIASHVVSCAVD